MFLYLFEKPKSMALPISDFCEIFNVFWSYVIVYHNWHQCVQKATAGASLHLESVLLLRRSVRNASVGAILKLPGIALRMMDLTWFNKVWFGTIRVDSCSLMFILKIQVKPAPWVETLAISRISTCSAESVVSWHDFVPKAEPGLGAAWCHHAVQVKRRELGKCGQGRTKFKALWLVLFCSVL